MQWYTGVDGAEALARARGRRVVAASSSLTFLSVTLDDGHGLLVEARTDGDSPRVGVAWLPASSLPQLADAVCAVDWHWIEGSALGAATLDEAQLRLELEPAGPLTVSAALWQGAPFLAFQPYRAPQS
jgi:hypothetical protein